RAHVGDGMGELFARLPSEDLDAVWTGADAWARRAKASGDGRTLDQLRVAALVRWARSFLSHGDSSRCDEVCHPRPVVPADPEPEEGGGPPPVAVEPAGRPPTRHGRPVTVRTVWALKSLLGVDDRPGELADSNALLTPDTMRAMIAD